MTKQTKGLLALGLVGVVAYLILREKKTANFSRMRYASGVQPTGVNYKYQLLQEFMAYPVQQCGRVRATRGYKIKAGDIIIANAYSCWNGYASEYDSDGNLRQIHTTIAGVSGDILVPANVLRLIST